MAFIPFIINFFLIVMATKMEMIIIKQILIIIAINFYLD